MSTTLDLENILSPDTMAVAIAAMFMKWNSSRESWLGSKREIRNYIFATDTTTTTNSQLPWKNSTTIPKLCQIRDNLHSNYLAALFPHRDWLIWEGGDRDSQTVGKRDAIESYMKNKLEQGGFRNTVSLLIYDYIDYGNCFFTTKWVDESKLDQLTGETIPGFVGPKLIRLNPEEVVFNPLASEFKNAPKIIRSIKTLGEIKRDAMRNPDNSDAQDLYNSAIAKAEAARSNIGGLKPTDIGIDERFNFDGFGSAHEYFTSGYVEILTMYGDFYDVAADKFYEDHIIKVIDRTYVLSVTPNPSWISNRLIHHVGWRLRQDNLYAMGPLDNLIGMQYRIDHLENLKADVFDLIAHPVLKITGDVEDFEYGPGARIYVGDEGDVSFMHPDTTALNADNQIASLEAKMEEMAGAPKEAMGFRTPGEKTAFEVQQLTNSSNRIFQNKVQHFEVVGLEEALNMMLEQARRNMSDEDVIRTVDKKTDAVFFKTITKEDIASNGVIKPRGASHFARKSQIMQNLASMAGSGIGADPAVNVHISGKVLASMVEELLDLKGEGLVQENVRILEQMTTERLVRSGQEQLAQEDQLTQQDQMTQQDIPPVQ